MELTETLTAMESLMQALISLGGPGIALAITVFFFNKQSNLHRDEREEHRKDFKEVTEKFDRSLSENTRALTSLSEKIDNNKCKAN